MVQLTGVAECASKEEARRVVEDLQHIPAVKFNQFGNRIDVYYTPDCLENDTVVAYTMRRILDVLEQVEEHGFSTIS